jgi:hypothetical protein
MVRATFLAGVLAVIALRSDAQAQVASMVGTVRDSVGQPIADAELSVGSSTARTDTLGRYYLAFPRRDSITVHVRRLGYERVTFTVTAAYVAENTVEVRMGAVAQTLGAVTVDERSLRSRTALEGFDFRRARGTGIFITRADIASRGTQELTNVLRGYRGVEVIQGRMGRNTIRFAQWRGKGCDPQVWLDGNLVRGASVDDFPASEIEAIELYDGPATTPGEFIRGPTINCGAVVLWSRIPLLQRSSPP